MKIFKKKLLTAVTVMALSPLAQATLLTVTDEHTSSATDWTDILTVSQFDASLGTLDTVTITFSASMLSDMILDNDNLLSSTAKGTVTVDTLGSFVGLGGLFLGLSANTGFQSLGADDSGNTDNPGDGGLDEYVGLGLFSTDTMSVTIDASSADFLSFIGTGNISTVNLHTSAGYGLSGGGANIGVQLNTIAGASLNVDYNYTAPSTSVSEPASLGILGLGLMGVALRRKKKSL
jgi:hypothetical protein